MIVVAPSRQSNSAMIDWLSSCEPPRIVRTIDDLAHVRVRWLEGKDRKWIHLDGASMPDLPSAYSTLIHAFSLPAYFGRNLAALRECLTDADVLGSSAFAVYFENPTLALKDANSEALLGLLDAFANAAEELGQPIHEAASWDRPALPFHVLLGPDNNDPRLQSYPLVPDSGRPFISSSTSTG